MREDAELAHLLDRLMRRFAAGLHGRALTVDVDRIGPLGGMLLLSLQEIEPAPIQKLVVLMGRDKSQMTRLIQMLESKGYLQRQPSPSDGRVSLLRLTSKGSAFVGELGLLMSEVVGEVLSPLSANQRKTLASLLRKV